MSPTISPEDRCDANELIREFCSLAVDIFGTSVQLFSLHALRHLPEQTLHFGGLYNISASMFESVFYQLKRRVTGTRNEGHLIVTRFLKIPEVCSKRLLRSIGVSVLGQCLPFPLENDFLSYGFTELSDCVLAYRFRVEDVVYHSASYPKKRSSVSYNAYLRDSHFVRIDHILKRGEQLFCLSTEIIKLGKAVEELNVNRNCALYRR